MKIPEHLKEEELVYYYSNSTFAHYYTFVKSNKSSKSSSRLEKLLEFHKTGVPEHTLPFNGKTLLRAPLKNFFNLYPEHFL